MDLLALHSICCLLLQCIIMEESSDQNLDIMPHLIVERQHEISDNVACATSKGLDQPGHTRSLIRAFASRLNIL